MSAPATLDHAAIAARIPHRGAMCLLDRVEGWDGGAIRCRASSHRAPDNPLREPWGLPATAAIEYAAQAMAVHGALVGGDGGAPRVGYLASVRSVEFGVARLDTIAGELEIRAERLNGDERSILYAFSVTAAGTLLVSGRAAVVLDAGPVAGEAPGSPA
jgi:predicted hotdog family 3-hydroxylacyl-ACP dehydratase